MVINNVQLFYAISERMMLIEFKNMVIPLRTYSVLEGLKMLGFDCFHLLRVLGSDWERYRALRMPLSGILISHFFLVFSNYVLLSHASFQPISRFASPPYVSKNALGLIIVSKSSFFNAFDI